MHQFMVGLDVGSTTVKAIVVDAATDKTIWQDYQRHETRQPEKVLEFLRRMEQDTGIAPENTRIFVTGSGGGTIAEMIGAKFVQEIGLRQVPGQANVRSDVFQDDGFAAAFGDFAGVIGHHSRHFAGGRDGIQMA